MRGSEQLRSSTLVHGLFQRLQSIDLSFRLAGAPAFADGVAHRRDVAAQVLGQALNDMRPSSGGLMLLYRDSFSCVGVACFASQTR